MIKNLAVVGAGLMGSGIAQVCARSGFDVCLMDPDEAALFAGVEKIRQGLQAFADKGKLAGTDIEGVMGRLKTTGEIGAAVRDADIVLEAVPEDMELKKRVFREIDDVAPTQAIFTSNTSFLEHH